MAEVNFNFQVRLTPSMVHGALVVAVMLSCAPELGSESVTLTTYYPAPSGVYAKMITTSDAYLARDGGVYDSGTNANGSSLILGGVTPSNGVKLKVMAGEAWVPLLQTTGNNVIVAGASKVADLVIGSDSGSGANRHDSSIMMWSNASAVRLFASSDHLYLNRYDLGGGLTAASVNVDLAANPGQTSTFNGPLTIFTPPATAGNALSANTLIASNISGCSTYEYQYPTPGGGNRANICPGGYVTLIDGLMSKTSILQIVPVIPPNPTVTARCCPCPAGGCPL